MTRIRVAIVSSILTAVLPGTAMAQTVNLSLNLQYKNPAEPALGGAWTLVAKTDSAHGIASIHAILSNINAAGIMPEAGIGAVVKIDGSPFVTSNIGSVEFVYFQDLSSPASVVTNVGRGPGTPGNLPLDPLNDPLWNNSARIFSGTFSASTPAFTANADAPPEVTAANVLPRGVPPYTFATPASVTTVVRGKSAGPGDANLNGMLDANDYLLIDRGFLSNVDQNPGNNLSGWGNGDFSQDGRINISDFFLIDRAFATQAGALSAARGASAVSVPEPAHLLAAAFAVAALTRRRSK